MRNSPDPYNIIIDNQGFMFSDTQEGGYAYTQSKMPYPPAPVTPKAQDYATADPLLETPRGFFRFDNGMGFTEEKNNEDTDGYLYGLYIDSGSGYIINGPAVTSVTPAETDSVLQFSEFNVAGTDRLIAITQSFALYRNGAGDWIKSKGFSSGGVTTQSLNGGFSGGFAAVFAGTQTRDYLFVAQSTTDGYQIWDGVTATTTWTSKTDYAFKLFATYHDYLMGVSLETDGYYIHKTFNGGSSPTWGAGFKVTDLSNPVTSITVFNDSLYIGTERGLYTVVQEGDFAIYMEDITPAFGNQPSSQNCKPTICWWDKMYVPVVGTIFEFGSDGAFKEMGLGALRNNTSEVQGNCVSMAGYKNQTLFACFYNSTEDATYLMRWGGWRVQETNTGTERVFIPGWHGALYKFDGVSVNAMGISDIAGGNPRLWLGDDDGIIHYFVLPRYNMDWRGDTNCRFNIDNPGEVFLPSIHHGVPYEVKSNMGIALISEGLTASNTITVAYRVDPASSYETTNIVNSGIFTSSPGQRLNFSVSTVGRLIDIKATLTNTSATSPCVMKAVAIYQAIRPTFKWVYKASLVISDGVVDNYHHTDGRSMSAEDLLTILENAANNTGTISIVTPSGDSVDVLVTNLDIELRRNNLGRREWIANIEMLQHASNAVSGTYGRTELRTYAELEAYLYSTIETL
jgi:hypothetical protein